MTRSITVGISTYRDYEHLEMLLQSIRWYTYQEDPEFQIIVCDDGTADIDDAMFAKTRETAEKYGAAFMYHERNMGIPATWNHLALAHKSDIVVLLNNDLLMPPNWLRCMHDFFDMNWNAPQLGSVFWQPWQPWDKEAMRFILPYLGHTLFMTQDQVTGQLNRGFGHPSIHSMAPGQTLFESRQGEGHGIGRVMCPCGCCFAFKRETFEEVGPFNEKLTSFHEESDWGTRCAYYGKGAYALPYPKPYHKHGFTFGQCPELQASQRMRASRRLYREIWDVPESVSDTEYFTYVNERLMPRVVENEWQFLSPDYSLPPVERTLAGGEYVKLPQLVVKTHVC